MYNKDLHERLRPMVNKDFWHPHECRELENIFLLSENFLNGSWRCPECVQGWVNRLKVKFDAFEAAAQAELKAELEKAAKELEEKKNAVEPVKKENKNKKKSE